MNHKLQLGVGPMSHDIMELISNYKNGQLLCIASRNQVDYKDSYACETDDMKNYLDISKNNVTLCRDHCGPYFKDSDTGRSLNSAIYECKRTIDYDIKNEFKIIHIDVSRCSYFQYDVAKELIEYVLRINPNIKLEFGTEDNIGTPSKNKWDHIDKQLEFLQTYKDNVLYFVSQTGSLTKDSQVGTFDIDYNTALVSRVHAAGFKFKEHNADYLTAGQVQLRTNVGIDAINIAPQLGTIQSHIISNLAENNKEWITFSELVYSKNKWVRWVTNEKTSINDAALVAGHYHFNSDEYRNLIMSIDADKYRAQLQTEIYNVFDTYLGVTNESNKESDKKN